MDKLSILFKALSDETRLRVVNLLTDAGELCVCDLESVLGCTQTKISRHMGYLKRAGLSRSRKSGRWVFYSMAAPATAEERLVLQSLRPILSAEPHAAKDREALKRLAASGCCAALNQSCTPHT